MSSNSSLPPVHPSEPPPTAVVRPDTTNVRHVPGCRPATHSTTRRTIGPWEILQDKELGSWCVLTELSKRCLRIFITPWCLITIQISNQPQTRYDIDILLKTTRPNSNPAQLNRLFIICWLVYIYETPTTTTVIQYIFIARVIADKYRFPIREIKVVSKYATVA